jgi:hypothetical protein
MNNIAVAAGTWSNKKVLSGWLSSISIYITAMARKTSSTAGGMCFIFQLTSHRSSLEREI